MNSIITAIQIKYSTQGWAKLIGLGKHIDKQTKLDDSTMNTVGFELLEFSITQSALPQLHAILANSDSPVEINASVSMVQKKGVAAIQIESAEIA